MVREGVGETRVLRASPGLRAERRSRKVSRWMVGQHLDERRLWTIKQLLSELRIEIEPDHSLQGAASLFHWMASLDLINLNSNSEFITFKVEENTTLNSSGGSQAIYSVIIKGNFHHEIIHSL